MDSIKLLDEVKTLLAQREKVHGPPVTVFEMIAGLWAAYLDEPISSVDVVNMMAMLKIARHKSVEMNDIECNKDNILDALGYLALTEELKELKE